MCPSAYEARQKALREGKEARQIQKTTNNAKLQAERLRFEAQMKGEPPQVRITFPAWLNALEDPPFDTGEFTWGLNIMFPFKVKKKACEPLKEKIRRAFEEVFLS